MREPILRYSMAPEKEYRYCTKDSSEEDSIYSCRRKFDDETIIALEEKIAKLQLALQKQ